MARPELQPDQLGQLVAASRVRPLGSGNEVEPLLSQQQRVDVRQFLVQAGGRERRSLVADENRATTALGLQRLDQSYPSQMSPWRRFVRVLMLRLWSTHCSQEQIVSSTAGIN